MSNSPAKKAETTLLPADFLKGKWGPQESTALVILNSPISDFDSFKKLYDRAAFCVVADGGANRLHNLLIGQHRSASRDEALSIALPDIIHGDLDSIDSAVRQHYEGLGVKVTEDSDQYSTDFGKAIKKVVAQLPDVEDILVLGSIGGRVDQGLGLLNEIYREQKARQPSLRFWLFSEASITTLLTPGTTRIHTPVGQGQVERSVGILPLFGPARISTTGLQWDVDDWPTEMGGQVSTSNYIQDDWIMITTDRDVLFTIEGRHR